MQRPLIPMGAMTGHPTGQELRDWLDRYLDVGIDQFMIYARSGLEIKYLSADWFEACRCLVEHAARRGMAIWIYDEFNWPSGGAGGNVLACDPAFAARKLLAYRERPDEAAVEPITGGRAFCRIARTADSHAHDVLNPDAVDCFIRLTHEQYAEHFAKHFGSTIKGFFTDEPSFAYGNAAQGDSRVALELPWYPELETEYRGRSGRDFRSDLAEHLDGRTPADLWSTYAALLGVRFRFAFTERISRWCEAHGVISTGHFTNEFSPQTAIAYSGDPMMVTRSLTMPGIDEIFSHATLEETEWLTLKTVEQAAVHAHNGAMAELFALGPCDLSMARRRQMIWLAALHGVDHFFAAVSSLDARANAVKQEYYDPFTPDQPWFDGVQELGDEASRAAAFARKTAVYPIAVRFPQTLVSERSAAGRFAVGDGLLDLLRALVAAQWPALLVAETDTHLANHQMVLALQADGFVEETSGAAFPDIHALLIWLEDRLQRPAEVLNGDGRRAGDLLVKPFADGTAAVLSLSARDRAGLILQTGGESISFSLPGRGVFTFPAHAGAVPEDAVRLNLNTNDGPQPISAIEPPPELEAPATFPTAGLRYDLDSPTILRLTFEDSGVNEFELLDDLRDLRLVTRLHAGTVALELDGRRIETVHPCRSLPEGFRPLYAESAPLTLSAGKHTVRLVAPAEDFAYLPAAFVVGTFAWRGDGRIGRLPATLDLSTFFGAELRGFVGKVAFHAEIDGSESAAVRLSGIALSAELVIAGRVLGRRLWAPFVWPLPDDCRRSGLAVTLRLATSIGPLFGDPPAAFCRRYAGNHWFNPLRYWPAARSSAAAGVAPNAQRLFEREPSDFLISTAF